MPDHSFISVVNAAENNLRSVSLDIPKNKLVVVTGVSGSGKSSLVFDVLYRMAESRFLGSFSSSARQFLGKMKKPDVEKLEGLPPAVAIDQKSIVRNARSTVGTITGIYDYLRLLFARVGIMDPNFSAVEEKIDRSLFSFNSLSGACPACKGLGVEDRLDPDLMVADPTKSIRDRALVITAPNGYIIYSQVTMDVMDEVCKAEGFSVDIPWKDLTDYQKQVILYGSDKLEIPFGKHTLESRMTWSGITAKPREMGYYKGIIPVMETILKRDRNKNILRFVRTGPCSACNGTRLNDRALSVNIGGKSIAHYASVPLNQLQGELSKVVFIGASNNIAAPILAEIFSKITLLEKLGLGYLSLHRESTSLSAGEAQRMRLAVQSGNSLQGMLYLFDEPSIGLHPKDTLTMISVLKELRDRGNSVLVVEHDEVFLREADWIIDLGPGGGIHGGELLINSSLDTIDEQPKEGLMRSHTYGFLKGIETIPFSPNKRMGSGEIVLKGATHHNLKEITVHFLLEALNVVTGVSGAGKSSLVVDTLGNFLHNQLSGSNEVTGKFREITGWQSICKVITVDQSPIGRTPRSNPATYTGLFDHIRDLFSSQSLAKEMGLDKSHFSFNTAGGRCESCEGAGYQQIGMHFMGNVEVPCESCEGRRFKDEILLVQYNGKNIAEVLDLYISEAEDFFQDLQAISRYVKVLNDLGLGYIKLGQRSSTLSGGEAQRVKLATELASPKSDHTLYLLDEPTTGLHQADVSRLLAALNRLIDEGNTIVVIEHNTGFIAAADRVIDLGPGSGEEGGRIVATGTPEEVALVEESFMGRWLRDEGRGTREEGRGEEGRGEEGRGKREGIGFKGVTTNNLKNIDFFIPHNKITVVTGVSGSGKSSLAFDTVFAEGMNRYLDCFSPYVRARIGMREQADFEEVSGLTATLAVGQGSLGATLRSTVGTATNIYDLYRLLFSRIGKTSLPSTKITSSLFSFNHQHGACQVCKGLGSTTVCNPEQLIQAPHKSILDGAMDATKTGRFYGDPFGQYVATLKAVGNAHGHDYSIPWDQLSEKARVLALFGTEEEEYSVTWEFKRDKRTGEHHFTGKWIGLTNLVNAEYERKHADHRGNDMLPLMKELPCISCHGSRLNMVAMSYLIDGLNIAEFSALPINPSKVFFEGLQERLGANDGLIAAQILGEIRTRLAFLEELGLSYLTLNRAVSTLSGGESQRVKLAAQIGSGLTDVTYVLDEPTIGLHPSDINGLMKIIRKLKDAGNTVVIVEHDSQVIQQADYLLEIGPGAGKAGGKIVASGPPSEILHNPHSATGKYLNLGAKTRITKPRELKPGLAIENASANNLKGFHLRVPTGGIIAITGVSGSGKSTLVNEVIYASHLNGKPSGCAAVVGLERFNQVILVQQRSVFANSSGTPVTFTGIFTKIRDIFAKTEEAVRHKLTKNHFSFMNKEGRCETCQGLGRVVVSMDFLPDVGLKCESCHGKRFHPEVLSCLYQGKSISDLLEMSFEEASVEFHDEKTLSAPFELIKKVGLGYLQLGQALDTLSGGEAQRLVLATELMKPQKGSTLYLFEEPSTGLHFSDIEYLLKLFDELIDKGNSLIVVEHDPDIIRNADWIIDLGPEGGDEGGFVVSAGDLASIVSNPSSRTGQFLTA
jgi:excinuclease ABC subunit A